MLPFSVVVVVGVKNRLRLFEGKGTGIEIRPLLDKRNKGCGSGQTPGRDS